MVAHASQRRFGREHRAPRKPGYGPQTGLLKHRELRFCRHCTRSTDEVLDTLDHLGRIRVTAVLPRRVAIEYSLSDHSFRSIERHFGARGFVLDASPWMRLVRALLYFCEDTQLRNLRQPERLIKKSNEIYVQAWQQHRHGDHDDTPNELREYR
ncbi:hypothetical protein [Methyloversatilis thermotolerans]|uniref:hypothetical protein n=1 Tax=Methyloversatilis thermotolerans TaxID=1346290 RepID=UPI0003620FA2|nr:hypothetical protein [Methyloversatilis thermotolerans]